MNHLILAFVLFSVFWPVFGLDLPLPMGLSIKNLMLYVIAGLLIVRSAISGSLSIDNRELFFCYVFLIIYAALSIVYVEYWALIDNYSTLSAIVYLKNQVVDPFVVIGVCYYGIGSKAEARTLLMVFLVSIGIAFMLSVLSAAGVIALGAGGVDYSFGSMRMTGPFGHPNEFGVLAAVCLPLFVATTVEASGVKRLFQALLVVSAGVVMISTASRSAVFGLLFGILVTKNLYRNLPLFKVTAAMAGMVITVGGLATILISPNIIMTTAERFSFTGQTLQYASSGRTAVWSYALEKMADQPVSILTGFGWNAYEASNFALDVHSHYLNYLYNLGLIGAITTTLILVMIARKVRLVSLNPASGTGLLASAFCTGWWTLIFALLFIEMYVTWHLLAILAGTFLRIAYLTENTGTKSGLSDFGSGFVSPRTNQGVISQNKKAPSTSAGEDLQRGSRGFAR